jgi:hypothetical protein
MSSKTQTVTIKGRRKNLRAFEVAGTTVIIKGRVIRIAQIHDEYWLKAKSLPNPRHVLAQLRLAEVKPDLYTFTQRVPHVQPNYNYNFEWDNVAALPLTSYEEWFKNQITSAARRAIRASKKRGIVTKSLSFDERLIRGVMSIYNESPIRQGRRFWHYGKDFSAVREENGTYLSRSTFIGAFYGEELIGYLKLVRDEHGAAIMQLLSKIEYYDKRPNNALLSKAVELSSCIGVKWLLYEKFVYGRKAKNSLTDFKRYNGFIRMNVPRYYVPLSTKGLLALRLGLYRNQRERIPFWVTSRLIDLRSKWYGYKFGSNYHSAK